MVLVNPRRPFVEKRRHHLKTLISPKRMWNDFTEITSFLFMDNLEMFLFLTLEKTQEKESQLMDSLVLFSFFIHQLFPLMNEASQHEERKDIAFGDCVDWTVVCFTRWCLWGENSMRLDKIVWRSQWNHTHFSCCSSLWPRLFFFHSHPSIGCFFKWELCGIQWCVSRQWPLHQKPCHAQQR